MANMTPIITKRFLGYVFIASAIFTGLVGCFCFLISRIAPGDPIGSLVFHDAGKTCAIVAGTFACLALYTLIGIRKIYDPSRRR